MYQILVYHNLNNDTYYYRIVRFSFIRYHLNSINIRNHQLVLIIRDFKKNKKKKMKQKLINRLIRFLEKLK